MTGSENAGNPSVAVVGIGNGVMGDDAVGERVIHALQDLPGPRTEGIRLYNAGTTGVLALEALSGCERAIIVDAVSAEGDPGTIYRFEFSDGSFGENAPPITMHDISFAEGMEAGREAYDLPDEIVLIGVEPARIEMSLELSEAVASRVPDVVDMVLEEVGLDHRGGTGVFAP